MGYERDLAMIHDSAFGGIARDGARCLLRQLRERGIPGGRVADLGCGSGITARSLAAAGYDVWGVDLSPAMVAMCRERVPGGEFVAGSVYDTDLPAGCVAVSAFGEILNYAFDDRAGSDQLDRIAARVRAALAPGGLFLFDFAEPGRGAESAPRTWIGNGWELSSEAVEDEAAGTLTRRITTMVGERGERRTSKEIHVLRLYPRDRVLGALGAAGFSEQLLPAYHEHSLPKGLVVVLATV